MKAGKPEPSSFWNSVAFVTLTVQTAATVLTMRYSRLRSPEESASGIPQFATTSAVALAEFGKMWVGIILLCYEIYVTKSSHDPFTTFSNQLFGDLQTLLLMAVPACTYAVQNTLLFVALHHLDSSLYQITYQLKIFTAALWAVSLLNGSYSTKQWLSFAMLAIGAALSNLSMQQMSHHTAQAAATQDDRNQYVGIFCVLAATVTSGFAGVFMEKQLKGSASLLVRNIQLGMFGFLMCFVNSFFSGDLQQIIIPYGFLHGFTTSTWIVVALNIFGGYLVAFVLKRASNIVKSFAAGLAVILIVIGSYMFFGTEFNSLFYLGAVLVLGGNALYQRESHLKSLKPKQNLLPK